MTRPDDWHIHLRDGEMLSDTANDAASQFARAIIMPNLKPPVTTTEHALAYHQRIMQALPQGSQFQPLMTLYLTNNTSPDEIIKAKQSGLVHAVKLYPAGATTNSDAGVTDLSQVDDVLAAMAEVDMPLLVHGEVTEPEIDIFDREKVFIERHLVPLTQRHSNLKLVLEHITTAQAAEFVSQSSNNVAATITAHHLLLNRNHLLAGGIRPHHYCLPVLKRETHRQALVKAAISGDSSFFLGTDSAPHVIGAKESSCGCAGIYTAKHAIELYASAFEKADALNQLEAFASHFGADFYQLPRNTQQITLQRKPQIIPAELPLGGQTVRPLFAGETLDWSCNS